MFARILTAMILFLALSTPARAEMVLNQVIVDIEQGEAPHDDIEVWNKGDSRIYVLAEPFEIIAPGTKEEARIPAVDPDTSGMLIAPQRLILEPGERRVIRIVMLGPRPDVDKVYRVAIRPVSGPIETSSHALQVLVGYDVLVLYRSDKVIGRIVSHREGNVLTLSNMSNKAQEFYDGKQCSGTGDCVALPAKRLYPGEDWAIETPGAGPVQYQVAIGSKKETHTF